MKVQPERQAEQLEVLYQIGQEITSVLDLDHVLEPLAGHIIRLTGAKRSLFLLLDSRREHLIKTTGHGFPPEHLDRITIEEVRAGISGWVLQTGEPVLIHNALTDPRNTGIALERAQTFNTGSLIVAPLRVEGEVVGTLTAINTALDPPFTDDDLKFAVMLANQAAIAVGNAQRYQETNRRRQLLLALDETLRHIRGEKETAKLLQEMVRLATELVGGTAGGILLNHDQLEELELRAVYRLPERLIGSTLSYSGAIGRVAQTGETILIDDCTCQAGHEIIFEGQQFKTAIVVPLRRIGEVTEVLFVAASANKRQFNKDDLDTLERFAAHAAVALHISRLMHPDQRMATQLAMLHKISNYIQEAHDLDSILHVVLTGVTAGYGLGFNRAALLLLDEREEFLVGRVGIGHLDEADAWRDWAQHHQNGLEDFGRYLKLLATKSVPRSPIDQRIQGLRLPLQLVAPDVFSLAALEGRSIMVRQDELDALPPAFVTAFQPARPFVIVPLTARSHVIGLLVADNKFTGAPITQEDVENLLTFANTAAISIDNMRLFEEARAGQAKLRSLYEASNTLTSPQEPRQLLREMADQTRTVANAAGVYVFLIDATGHVWDCIATGIDQPFPSDLDPVSREVFTTGTIAILNDRSMQPDWVKANLFEHAVAALCLPLAVQDEHLGVIWICYDRTQNFSTDVVEDIHLYINKVTTNYNSARRIRELEQFRQTAEALANATRRQEVFAQIVQSARTVLQADSAAILSYDPVRETFVSEKSVAAGISDAVWKEFQKKGPQPGGTAYAITKCGWLAVQDITMQQCRALGPSTLSLLQQIGARSFQGVSLSVGNEVLGVLYTHYQRPRTFSEDDRRMTQTFANHAALALKKATLLDQLRKAHNTAQVVAEVTLLADLQGTLESVARGTKGVLGCDVVMVYVYDQPSNQLMPQPIMVGVWYPERAARLPQIPDHAPVFKILRRDKMYIAADTTTDPLFKGSRFAKDEHTATCVAIPLRVSSVPVGVMFINYRTPHRLTDNETTNIELFANQAAIAIYNAQLYEREQKRVNALEALYEAGRALTSTLTLEETLNRIVEQAFMVVGGKTGKACFSMLGMVDGDTMRFTTAYPQEKLKDLQTKIGDIHLRSSRRIGVSGRAVQTKTSQNVANVLNDPDYLVGNSATRSELAVPIKIGGQIIGVINMEHPDLGAFRQEDQEALEAIARYAAIAIQNARLYKQSQSGKQRLETVSRISREAAESLEVPLLLRTVCQLLERDLGKSIIASVRLYDADRHVLVFDPSWHGPAADIFAVEWPNSSTTQRLDEGICGSVARHRQPLNIGDVHASTSPYIQRSLRVANIQSELCVPICYGEQRELVGVLDVQSTEPDAFDAADQQLLQTLADQLAVALQHARRYEQLRAIKGFVGSQTAVDWIRMVSTAWGHSIKREVGTALRRVALLRGMVDRTASIDEMLSELEYLANEIKSIRDITITAPLSSEGAVGSVKVNALVKDYLTRQWKDDSFNQIHLRLDLYEYLDKLVSIRASSEWLRQALQILVDNAVQAMNEADSPDKQLIARTFLQGDWVEIIIKDTGPGIPREVLECNFETPVPKPEGSKGAGIGLVLAQTIVRTYNGHIYVLKSDESGTEIVITFPVEK